MSAQTPYSTPAPQPMTPADERMWATLSHVGALFTSFIAPLIVFLVCKDRGPFVRAHSAAALNFQISLAIYSAGIVVVMVIGMILSMVLVGIPILLLVWLALIALAIANVVLCIIAAVTANKGEWYRYPLSISFVS